MYLYALSRIPLHVDRLRNEIDQLRASRLEAAATERYTIEAKAAKYTTQLDEVIDIYFRHVQKMKQVGMDVEKAREDLARLLYDRVDRLSGRIALSLARIDSLEERGKEIPDDTDAAKLLVASAKNLEVNTASMEAMLDLMAARSVAMFILKLDRTSVLLVVSAVIVIIHSAGIAGGAPGTEDITGVVWKWHQTRYNNDQQSVPDDPSGYTVTFNTDGTLNIRADCNRGGGSYTTEGKSISIEVTHTTRAMCPPESLDQAFIKDMFVPSILTKACLDLDRCPKRTSVDMITTCHLLASPTTVPSRPTLPSCPWAGLRTTLTVQPGSADLSRLAMISAFNPSDSSSHRFKVYLKLRITRYFRGLGHGGAPVGWGGGRMGNG